MLSRSTKKLQTNEILVVALLVSAIGLLFIGGVDDQEFSAASQGVTRRPTGSAQLVSYESLPAMAGEMCQWIPASANTTLAASLQQGPASGREPARESVDLNRSPIRMLKDANPTFSAIAVEPENNMLVMTDENLFQVMEYDRRDNTPPQARMTEPKRTIGGTRTRAEMLCGIYIDPKTLDTYVVNNDTQNWMAVFSKNAQGNAEPDRFLAVPHGAFGIAVDEQRDEMFITIQHNNAVVVYNKMASGEEEPLREIFGDDTELEDPHGITLDTRRDLIFVSNHGHGRYREQGGGQLAIGRRVTPGRSSRVYLLGSGYFDPPSITVYSRDAQGNVAPLRIIEGPKTRLNWPAHMAVDEDRGELYVANDMDNSILVFRVTDEGDVAPTRVIRGPKTGLKNPAGLALDLKNQEVWAANMGNHSATVFSMSANGDVPPLRTIRSGPADEPSLLIVNPGGVGYDSKREELLVPNWVGHPQIATFARLANASSTPNRVIAGQATKLSRTMHDIRYDPVHDEFLVTNPFANAVLVFRASAEGNEAPIRIIQGRKTLIGDVDRLDVDPVNNEIYVPNRDAGTVLVFPREANGDVAPIRILQGENTRLGRSVSSVSVDPVNDVVVVAHNSRDGIVIFDRTANGDAAPRNVIRGPNTEIVRINQMALNPQRKLVVAAQPGVGSDMEPVGAFVGVWSYDDDGDVPPRWKISAGSRTTLKKPRGVVLNPKYKEIIVADMRLNAVLTFYFPEIF